MLTRSRLLFGLRYAIPAVVCLAGIVIALIAGKLDSYGPDALAALFGAGGAIYLMNLFMRMGINGDGERDEEEARRLFLDRYGAWPDEVSEAWREPETGEDRDAVLARLTELRRHSTVAV